MSRLAPHKQPTQQQLKICNSKIFGVVSLIFLCVVFLIAMHIVVNVMPYDLANFVTSVFEN